MAELTVRRLKSRILSFVAIILVAVIGFALWSILSERRDALLTAERQAEGYAKALAEHSESALAEADRLARDVLHEVRREGGVNQIAPRELFDLLHRQSEGSPQIGSLFMADRAGTMFTNTLEFPPKQVNVRDREYFRHYLATPGADLTFSKPVISRLVNRWRFNLMRPLNLPDEPFTGLIAVAFEVEYFKKFFSSASLGPQGKVLLILDDGLPVVFEPYEENAYEVQFQASSLFREKLPAAPDGTYHGPLTPGRAHSIISYRRLSRYPLVAVIALNEEDVLAAWTRKAFVEGTLTIAFCFAAMVLTRLLFRHLRQLGAAQAQIMEQQRQLQLKVAQIDAANDTILQIDDQGRLVQFNQAFCDLTGYSREELLGISMDAIELPGSAEQAEGVLAELTVSGQATYEAVYRTKAGGQVPVEIHSRRMPGEDQSLILGIVRDISQRKREELREKNRQIILEEMATEVSLPDLLGHIVRYVEQESPGALCSILLVDESGSRLRHGSAPSLPDAYNAAIDGTRIAMGIGSCGTAAFLKKRVTVADIEIDPYWQGFDPARDAGLRAAWSEPVLSAEGELLGILTIYYREPRLPGAEESALIDSAVHLASIAIGRVRSEELRRRLEEQLLHVQKIEAVGQLAGGIAHDFNNLLTPIVGYAEMIKLSLPVGDPLIRRAEGIVAASLKARDLTRKLLSFGRKQMLCLDLLDVNDVIRSFQDILRRTIRENISFEERLTSDTMTIKGDRGQLEQVLLNLAVNAQDAISGNGTITIETGHVILDDEYAIIHPGLRVGHYVLLAFSDDGCGMDEKVLQHIFEPFYTTKAIGHGTGLGLAMAYGIVKQHEGFIEVNSRVGAGTTFRIFLPVDAGEQKTATVIEHLPAALLLSEQQKTVLVVEDNAMVRDMAVDLLKLLGCQVLSAESPMIALAIAEHHEGIIDALVSDVIMPEMNGLELYERLQVLCPGLPVLFMSGYTSDVAVHGGTLEEGVNFLAKPFTTEQFVRRVQELLAR